MPRDALFVATGATDALTVAEFRVVVQDQLEAVYLASSELPMVRAIERSHCEDVLVSCYALAARAAEERDQCRAVLGRLESVIDQLLEAGA